MNSLSDRLVNISRVVPRTHLGIIKDIQSSSRQAKELEVRLENAEKYLVQLQKSKEDLQRSLDALQPVEVVKPEARPATNKKLPVPKYK